MGIKFSHCDANWSFGGFSRFRKKLANEIGMELSKMEGFGGIRSFSDYKDNIIPLLDHEDDSGGLTISECKVVSPRLRQLIDSWDEDSDKNNASILADGMDLAIESNEPLVFK